jgi:type I restriction enzyme S subunit
LSLQVRIPPLPEQRAIAHILGTLDDKIELNRRMARTLEEMARALFKAWFVDFEPVRAKMDGRWRRGESLPGLPAHLYDLFPDRLVDSELGPIPEGWEVKSLSQVSEKPQYGYTASASKDAIGPHFLRITDINKQPWVDWSSVPFCAVSSADREKYLVRPGDVLIARMADPGHGVVIEEEVDAVFASYLIRFRLLD